MHSLTQFIIGFFFLSSKSRALKMLQNFLQPLISFVFVVCPTEWVKVLYERRCKKTSYLCIYFNVSYRILFYHLNMWWEVLLRKQFNWHDICYTQDYLHGIVMWRNLRCFCLKLLLLIYLFSLSQKKKKKNLFVYILILKTSLFFLDTIIF